MKSIVTSLFFLALSFPAMAQIPSPSTPQEQYELGMRYYYGQGVEKDYAEAARLFGLAAEQGYSDGQYKLGDCYCDGYGVPKDSAETVNWYRKSVDSRNPKGMYCLGVCYDIGFGVEKDTTEAQRLYTAAVPGLIVLAKGKDVEAIDYLARCYHYGNGVAKDEAEAVKWYHRGAEQGGVWAQNHLGGCYYYGEGVTQDYAVAVKWYRIAAEQGDALAQIKLGNCYYVGKGVTKNYEEAVKWYRKAAEQGDTDAQCMLGMCYYNGKGVTQDYAVAVKWYKMAAEQGDALAQYELGNCYYVGKGVTKNYEESVNWFRKSAEQGDADAQYILGMCYYYGEGVTKDYAESVNWYNKAAVQGHTNAIDSLANYYFNLGNFSKAVEYASQIMEIRRSNLSDHEKKYSYSLYAHSLEQLAKYYSRLGDYTKAVDYENQAMDVYQSILDKQDLDYVWSMERLADYYSLLGDYTKTVEYRTQVIDIYRSYYSELHPLLIYSLMALFNDYNKFGDYSKAMIILSETMSITQRQTLYNFSGISTIARNLIWEEYSVLFTDVYPFYHFLYNVTAASNLYDKSALFAKGLLLSTEIEINRLIQESGDEETLHMYNELQNNRKQLQELYKTPIAERHVDTDSLTNWINYQDALLTRRSAVYGDFSRKLCTTWKEVQQALQPDEIAVEFLSFYVGEKQTMIVALTLRKDDKEPKFIPLFEQRQLKTVSDTMYYHCPELTDLVWKPLQQELKGIKRIYFSPAGALHNIGIEYAPGMENFEMFRLSTTREVIDMKEKGEMLEIATTPSPSFPKEGSEVTPTATLFGGIDYNASLDGFPPSLGGGQGEASVSVALHRAFIDSLDIRGAKVKIQELPGTRTEVEEIKRSFDNKHRPSALRMGYEATETAVKVLSGTKPNILHIATHGFYFTENQAERQKGLRFLSIDGSPSLGRGLGKASSEDKALTRSGLLMAGANVLKDKDLPMGADDGILTAQEISQLDLRGLDLVVLSACKTGNGDINQGEGVFGLQRGFKKAGAQTLVMSLWEVDDNATQILMTTFYDNLLQGQSKRDAFHNAQQHLRTVENGRYDKPQFWAAFVLLD